MDWTIKKKLSRGAGAESAYYRMALWLHKIISALADPLHQHRFSHSSLVWLFLSCFGRSLRWCPSWPPLLLWSQLTSPQVGRHHCCCQKYIGNILYLFPNLVSTGYLCLVSLVTGGAAPFGPALIEKFMEKVRVIITLVQCFGSIFIESGSGSSKKSQSGS